jgi:hypothetical protein
MKVLSVTAHALLLIALAASASAGILRFDALEEYSLEGIYHSDVMKPYIMFSADIENETNIGSHSGIFLGQKGGLVSFVTFDVDGEQRHNKAYMKDMILSAARVTAAMFYENPALPIMKKIVKAYGKLYDELTDRLLTMKNSSQVLYSVALHNVIVKSASRVVDGVYSDSEICTLSVEYVGDVALFACDQDKQDSRDVKPKRIMQKGRFRRDMHGRRRRGSCNCFICCW